MKKWGVILAMMTMTLNVHSADVLKTVINPYTGKMDYIHRLSSTSAGDLLDITTTPFTNGYVMTVNTTTGKITPTALPALLPLPAGATNYIQHSTAPTGGVFNVSSGTAGGMTLGPAALKFSDGSQQTSAGITAGSTTSWSGGNTFSSMTANDISIGKFQLNSSTSIGGIFDLSGYATCLGTGTIGPNTSITVAPQGATSVIPVNAVDFNNNGLVNNNVKIGAWTSIGPTFPVRNEDALNSRNFLWEARCK